MTKLATPGKSRAAFAWDLLFVLAMWVIGSTVVGWVLNSWKGHGGIVLVFGMWLIGLLGFLAHSFLLFRRWRGPSSESDDAS